MNDTYLVSSVIDPGVQQFSGRRRRPAERLGQRTAARKSQNDFAAIKSGLDGVRQQFYGASGRMPNSKADATRRQRSLSGGSGERHLTQLDLWTEREISRHLFDQSTIFAGIIETWAAEVIQSGFTLKPDTRDDDLNTLIKELLFGWDGEEGWMAECDARGLMHFWDIITLAEETEAKDGDHAFYCDPDGNNGRGSIAIIEGDRILTPYGYKEQSGYTISNGIVWNDSGYPVSVFVADTAPQYAFCSIEQGRFYPIFRKWKAAEGGIVLAVDIRRPTSTRRQPWLSAAVRAHDEIDDVFVAVRVALRNAACRSTYTKIADWDAYRDWLEIVDPSTQGAPIPVEGLTHSPNPGDHILSNPGEEPGVLETNAPGSNFDPFMQLQLTTLGLPMGMCIEEALRIFQKSFSASRMAVASTRYSRYERRQKRVKRRKVTPLLQFAIARHQVKGLLPNDPRCNHIRCTYPGWPYIEPLKDAQASEILVDKKLISRRTLRTETGYDSDAEELQIKREEALYPEPASAPRTNTFIDAGAAE
jgi:capsid protein